MENKIKILDTIKCYISNSKVKEENQIAIPEQIKQVKNILANIERLKKEAKDLKLEKVKLEKIDIENIEKNLSEMFSKLTKGWVDGSISIDIDGATRVNNKCTVSINGSNAMNTFSQGQLSVFMLSYFLTNLFYNNKVRLKLGLFDDITHSLDDLNVNSFIDTLKYSMCDNKKLNQLFFTTHDKNLVELINIKMQSRDISCKIIDLDKITTNL